jgi:hypothetical protein
MVQSFLHFSKSVAPFIKVGRSTLCAEGDGKVAPVSLLCAISHVSKGPQMSRMTSNNRNSCTASHEFSNGLEERKNA